MIKNFRSWLRVNMLPTVYRFSERFGFHIYPVHYYSPLPNTRELVELKDFVTRRSDLVGIDMRLDSQFEFLERLQKWKPEYDQIDYQALTSQSMFGPGFGEIESAILHAMVREFQPAKIIEVGSGFSSWISSRALAMNSEPGELICIEPHPYPALKKLDQIGELIPKRVQLVDISLFDQLTKNDILFIDSSHIVKIGSDVVFLFLDVLPRLKPGVIVHIHDISFPYVSMQPMRCLQTGIFYNEVFLTQAFLTFNSAYEIVFCSSLLHFEHPDKMTTAFSRYNNEVHRPSSLWIRRK